MKSRRLRKRLGWNLLFLSAVFAVLIALNTMDYWQPMLSHESSCSSREAGISGPDEFLFKHLILRFGDAPSSHVSLVTMGDVEGADLLADVCSGRRFTADILDALNRQHASVIALDKVYRPNSCKDAAANTALVTAAERSQAKLVAARRTASHRLTLGT